MADPGTRKAKARLVEQIAAWLHGWPGVRVEPNARLLPRHGRKKRRREIDVLLHTSVAGYPVRIAIECKNERRPVDGPAIDAFVGKLQYVGIPVQHGVFISASGYTDGALDRAQDDGVRTLKLQGLSADGLKAAVTTAAHHSIVFLAPRVEQVSLFFDPPSIPGPPPLFVDSSGNLCGTVPHLLAQAWQQGHIPLALGVHDTEVAIPDSWRPVLFSGRPVTMIVPKVFARIAVDAMAFTVEGVAEQFSLVDSMTSRTEKLGLRAAFPEIQGRIALTTLPSEEELAQFLSARTGLRVTQRIVVPRIFYVSAFWPLSRSAATRMRELGLPDGKAPLVEGRDLMAAWDEPMTIAELDEYVFAGFSRRLAASTP
jgi:hypothetical protein